MKTYSLQRGRRDSYLVSREYSFQKQKVVFIIFRHDHNAKAQFHARLMPFGDVIEFDSLIQAVMFWKVNREYIF